MATTGNLVTDITIIWLPVALAVIMGLIGLLRGARREAVVSLAIVLAALIISVWSASWASDLHASFSGLGQQDTQTWLGVVVFVLVTLVIGYGMGSAVTARAPLAGASRIGGLVVGLANGAALGGWLLRNYYNALLPDLSGNNLTVFNTLTDNVISRYLIIWAGWFPLVVALVAAVVALIAPFRKAQTVVATPSAQSNWTPSTAPAVAAGAASYAPQYPQQYSQPQPQSQYTQPYAQQYQPQFGAQPQPQAPIAPVQPAPAVYAQPSYTPAPVVSPQPARVQDAPPTMPMPTSSSSGSSSSAGQETLYFGTTPTSASSSSAPLSGGKSNMPNTGPLGDLPDSVHNASSSSTPAWAQPPDSSWMAAPRADNPSPSVDSSAVARSEAPTMAYPVGTGSAPSSSSTALTNCPRCGALVPGDATFCTECGNRMKV